MLKIFSGLTTCSEVTIFLGVTNCSKVMFLSGVTIFLAKIACFARNTCIKGAGTEGANTKSTGIGAAYSKSAYIRNALTCASSASACAGGACTEGAYIGVTSVKDAYVRDISAIKCLGIHLESSCILELKQYSPALETKIGAS